MVKTTQNFKLFEMTGAVSSVDISIVGGCNIHDAINDHMNEKLKALSKPDEPYRTRNFQVVYGYDQLDALHEELFLPGASEKPDFDAKFDFYYARAFLSAEKENRKLKGKVFSEAAFGGAPPTMSIHVTIALST